MPPAARVGAPTAHPGVACGPGVTNVLIGGLPAAVKPSTTNVCAAPTPHAPTPFTKASTTVFIGGSPALRAGDPCSCGAPILVGLPTVLIGG